MRDRIRRVDQKKLHKVRKFKKCEILEDNVFMSEAFQKKLAERESQTNQVDTQQESEGK